MSFATHALKMSNINQNKDGTDEGKKDESRNNDGQSQILAMIRFDASAVSQQPGEVDTTNTKDMDQNPNKSSKSRESKS